MLKAENVAYVVAPYEADAQLAYLEKKGIVDGIITEDSDLLVFGCRKVLFKMDSEGACVEIKRDHFTKCREFSFSGWSDVEFRQYVNTPMLRTLADITSSEWPFCQVVTIWTTSKVSA